MPLLVSEGGVVAVDDVVGGGALLGEALGDDSAIDKLKILPVAAGVDIKIKAS